LLQPIRGLFWSWFSTTRPAWRVEGEIRALATLVDATFHATADVGSIPTASIRKALLMRGFFYATASGEDRAGTSKRPGCPPGAGGVKLDRAGVCAVMSRQRSRRDRLAADRAAVVRRYDEAWAEADAGRRLDTLSEIWADDGLYVDPNVPEGVRGARALSDFIVASSEDWSGLTIRVPTDLVVLGDRAWSRWSAATQDGQSLEGTDFIEFALDDRIQRVTHFEDE
jgi:SnoaL-like domain